MAVNRVPVLKRCRTLGLDPVYLGIDKKSNRKSGRANKKVCLNCGLRLRRKALRSSPKCRLSSSKSRSEKGRKPRISFSVHQRRCSLRASAAKSRCSSFITLRCLRLSTCVRASASGMLRVSMPRRARSDGRIIDLSRRAMQSLQATFDRRLRSCS